MMRHYIILIVTLSAFYFSSAQSLNEKTQDPKGAQLIGKINQEGLSKAPFSEWFTSNYEAYSPQQETIHQLKNELSAYTIIAFMGTWCGDSKQKVPRFYKVLKEANFPMDRLTTIAVSRDPEHYKQSPGGEEVGLNIHRVPTFIFYKEGIEINRIVESPVTSIEEDILAIIQKNYTPEYEVVHMVNSFLKDLGVVKFQQKTKKLLKKIRPIAQNVYELNTYSNVLFTAGKTEEAIAVARLNLLLYPNEAQAKKSLKNKLEVRGF
jgi:thiol-disulfide isomerase/thioredoxin